MVCAPITKASRARVIRAARERAGARMKGDGEICNSVMNTGKILNRAEKHHYKPRYDGITARRGAARALENALKYQWGVA